MVHAWRDAVPLSDEQRLVREGIREICADFGPAYWREKDRREEYPAEFVDALAGAGWLGILVPEDYGGAGMATPEAVVMMEELAANGGGFSAAQAVHGGIYTTVPIAKYADPDLKASLLPAIARGEVAVQAFGLTEPNAGSNAPAMETRARREGDTYVIDGQKIWISRVEASDYLLLLARTDPVEAVEKPTRGISMFLVDLEDAFAQDALEIRAIPKTVSGAVHAYEMWFSGLAVPASRLIGEEGEGFYQVLDGLNEERMVIAAECVGLGIAALERAIDYANDRAVFGRPIGAHQAIQHPLAEAYAHVLAAKQLVYSAARRLEAADRREAGALANVSKYLAAEACFAAADAAVQTHGGFGVAREYDVERYFREARLTRIVPISQQLALNYLGETVLGLPRSY